MRQGLASVSEGSSLCQTRRTMEGKGWSLRLQAVPKSSLASPDADTPIRRPPTRSPYPAWLKTNFSIAWANPSFAFESVTKFASA